MPDETHLGQTASHHVLLVRQTNALEISFVRVLPNFDSDPPTTPPGYSPPAGRVLVVTDVDWWVSKGNRGDVVLFRVPPRSV